MSDAPSYVVRIKRETFRPNPNAGRSMYLLPGRIETHSDGSQSRSVTPIYSLSPEGRWSFQYEDGPELRCEECGEVFLREDLLTAGGCECGCGCGEYEICPHCSEPFTEEIVWEDPLDVAIELGLN